MKSSSNSFYRIIVCSALISIFEIMCAFFWFNQTGGSALGILARAFISGALFIAAAVFIIGRHARLFSANFSGMDKNSDSYRDSLDAFGGIPLKALLLFVLIQFAFLAGVFGIPGIIVLDRDSRSWIFLVFFSLGLLNAALLYVLSDRLATRTLLGHGLDSFPLTLRVNRQKAKIFIIPFFILLMTFTFAFSLSFLISLNSGGDFAAVQPRMKIGAFLVAALFCGVIVTLIRIWNANTGNIYTSIIQQMDQLVSSEKDITRRINIGSVDELGTIAGLFNQFCQSLMVSINDLKTAQAELTGCGKTLNENAENASAATAEITSGIDLVRGKAITQIDCVTESSAAIKKVTGSIESLDTLIVDQTASITAASASVEEMVSTIGSINDSISRMVSQFSTLESEARNGTELQSKNGIRVNEIAERSNALQEANKVIAKIAAQTNLLAMNAAIEAAHAGESGAGFSVVADEIRRLAETSAKESRTIKNEINFVQSSMGEMVESSRSAENSFRGVAENIGKTDALVHEIQMSISEQKEGATQILEALKRMNEISSHVREGSREMNEGNGIIVDHMEILQDSATDISMSVSEMATGAEGIKKGSVQVADIAGVTQDAIAKMESVITSFRT